MVRAGHQNGKVEMLVPKTPATLLWLDIFLSLLQIKHFFPKVLGKSSVHLLAFLCHHLLHSLTHPRLGPATLTLEDTGNCLRFVSDCHSHRGFFFPPPWRVLENFILLTYRTLSSPGPRTLSSSQPVQSPSSTWNVPIHLSHVFQLPAGCDATSGPLGMLQGINKQVNWACCFLQCCRFSKWNRKFPKTMEPKTSGLALTSLSPWPPVTFVTVIN